MKRKLNIAICGTFDVENYGDLLFPILAEHELKARLGEVNLLRFSYRRKSRESWIYEVHPIQELERFLQNIDGIIIGGGHLVRFDKAVAPGYFPEEPFIHHPTGYWLAPALLGAMNKLPVIWNAIGVSPSTPGWAKSLVSAAFDASDYIGVRDPVSYNECANISPSSALAVTPDTAFGVSNIVDINKPSSDFIKFKNRHLKDRPYVVVQSTKHIAKQLDAIYGTINALGSHDIVYLPIGPALGDSYSPTELFEKDSIYMDEWPDPLLLAEIIAHSDAVVGISLHLSITATVFGIPVFRPDTHQGLKYDIVKNNANIYYFNCSATLRNLLIEIELGKKEIDYSVPMAIRKVSAHWDHVCALLTEDRSGMRAKQMRRMAELIFTTPLDLEQLSDELQAYRPDSKVTAQLYWRRRGEGYTETQSNHLSISIDHLPVKAKLDIPPTDELVGIRFDPTKSPGVFLLLSLKVLSMQDDVIWEWDGTCESLSDLSYQDMFPCPISHQGAGKVIVITGIDPRIDLPMDATALEAVAKGGRLTFELSRIGACP